MCMLHSTLQGPVPRLQPSNLILNMSLTSLDDLPKPLCSGKSHPSIQWTGDTIRYVLVHMSRLDEYP